MAISFDEIWTNVKKNALGAKDLAGLKLKLTKEKSHLDELYRNLGMNVYSAKTGDEENKSAEIIEEISRSLELIRQTEDEIGRIVGSVRCPGCDRSVARTYSFCPHCGAELPKCDKDTCDTEFDSAFDEMVGKKSSEENSDNEEGGAEKENKAQDGSSD